MSERVPESDSRLARAEQLGYEPRDASLGVAWWGGGGLVVLVVGSLLAMGLAANWLAPGDANALNQSPATPRNGSEIRLRQARLAQQQAQQAALSRYQWLDQRAGTAQIPIERAMDLLAADPALLAGESKVTDAIDANPQGDCND